MLLRLAVCALLAAATSAQPLSVVFKCGAGDAEACVSTLAACTAAPLSLAQPSTVCACYASAALCLADCGGAALRAGDAAGCQSAGCAAAACTPLLLPPPLTG